MELGSDCLLEEIRKAWIETLPRIPFDPDLSWEDSGADSLKSLQFLMRLETAIGRPLNFEHLPPFITPRQLARELSATNSASMHADEGRPQVYLLPGVYGDGPSLARLREAAAGRVRLELVDLPGIEVHTRVHEQVEATAALVLRRIDELHRDGPLMIAGFSYGGIVAQAAARQLQEQGRGAALLILLDPHIRLKTDPGHTIEALEEVDPARGLDKIEIPDRPAQNRLSRAVNLRRLLGAPGEDWASYRTRLVFGVLLRLRMVEAARRYIIDKPGAPEQRIWRRKALLGLARQKAVERWKPQEVFARTLLLMSLEGSKWRMDTRWRPYCPNLTGIDLPAFHMDMLSGTSLEMACAAIVEHVEATARAQEE